MACLELQIAQTQFLALAARIGGPSSAQTEAALTLSDGLSWSNGHVFNIWGKNSAGNATDDSKQARRSSWRRAGKSAEGDMESGASKKDENVFVPPDCDAMKSSKRELFSTIITAVGALSVCIPVRMGFNRLMKYLKTRKGEDPAGFLVPFPGERVYT
jgi:hypothetical protein